MIEKFNGIVYLIIFVVHFLVYAVYAFRAIVGTKGFMDQYNIEAEYGRKLDAYDETASYGHMGRKCIKKTKSFNSKYSDIKSIEVELFPWEKLDYIEQITKTLKL